MFFSNLVVTQLFKFSVAVHIYKIHVFDEAFLLLTIRMTMATKLSWAVIFWEQLTHKYACHLKGVVVLWGHMTNKMYITTCMYRHQTR